MPECTIPHCEQRAGIPYHGERIWLCNEHSLVWHHFCALHAIEGYTGGGRKSVDEWGHQKVHWTPEAWMARFKQFCQGYVYGSPLPGVTKNGNRWRARVYEGGQEITVGYFKSEVDAYVARERYRQGQTRSPTEKRRTELLRKVANV